MHAMAVQVAHGSSRRATLQRGPASVRPPCPGAFDRLRRASNSAAFFNGPPLQRLLAPWSPPPSFSRDVAAERRRGEDKLALFDAEDPSELRRFNQQWGEVDDVVMGGCSSSQARLLSTAHGRVLAFTGVVSAARGGGFASARTRDASPPWDLSAFEGIRLRVRGDGQRYKLALRDSPGWTAPAFESSFDAAKDVWTDVHIPWARFTPGGWRRADHDTLRCFQVYSLQLILSKFDDGACGGALHVHAPHERMHGAGWPLNPFFAEGPFELWVQRIEAYKARGSKLPPSIIRKESEPQPPQPAPPPLVFVRQDRGEPEDAQLLEDEFASAWADAANLAARGALYEMAEEGDVLEE